MSIFDQLKAMNDQYKQASPAAGSKLPDGKYRAICKEACLLEATDTKPITLSCSFIVMEGEYKGRLLFISQRIVAEETAFKYLKRFLEDLQVPVDNLYQLEDALPEFTGRMIFASVVTSKNDSRYQNVYVDEYLGKGDVEPYLIAGKATGNDAFQPVEDSDDLPF